MTEKARGGKYRLSNQREKNKARRILRHLVRHENDLAAKAALVNFVDFLPKEEREFAA